MEKITSIILYLLFDILPCLLSSQTARAEYIFFRTSPCEQAFCSVDENDPNWSKLFKIILENQWPMSLAYQKSKTDYRTEETAIHEELKKLNWELHFSGSSNAYAAIWVPPTLYDVFLLSYITQDERNQFKKFWLHADDSTRSEQLAKLKAGQTIQDADLELDQFIFPTVKKHAESWLKNIQDRRTYGHVNSQMGQDLQNYFPKVTPIQSLQQGVLSDLLISQKAHEYLSRTGYVLVKRAMADFHTFSFKSIDARAIFDPTIPWYILQLCRQEILAIQSKKDTAFLYRGTGGVSLPGTLSADGREIVFALDSAFDREVQKPISLSYGVSFFAGVFKDEEASAVHYFPKAYTSGKEFGYVLSINKHLFRVQEDTADELFWIPATGPIANLTGRGEHFHARSMIGTKDLLQKEQRLLEHVEGFDPLFDRIFAGSPKNIKEFENRGMSNPWLDSRTAATRVTRYIADYAMVISTGIQTLDTQKAYKALQEQRELAVFEEQELELLEEQEFLMTVRALKWSN
jgi:hypothetical protein